MKRIFKPLLNGIIDATPLGSINRAFKDYKDKTRPDANLAYLITQIGVFILIGFFIFGKLDLKTLEDLVDLLK